MLNYHKKRGLMSSQHDALMEKINSHTALIGVVGLGYVGLPLVVEFTGKGFHVAGYDILPKKVETLAAGKSDVDDISAESVSKIISNGLFKPSTDPKTLANADIHIICVPTPLSEYKDPDLSYIESATMRIVENFKPGSLVILESTTYPGTTEEIVAPMFERAGFTVGTDVFIAFSPERVDPGNPRFNTGNTPKVVGGMGTESVSLSVALYSSFLEKVIPVSSPAAAELVKLLENTFRSVNIALINEMAMICEHLKLDIWEIIEAAKTKPFGFMPFYPGPGVGGHCIPIDPHYLSWKLKAQNFYAHFIELAGEINYNMPNRVIEGILRHANDNSLVLKNADVLLLGMAYKNDISDVRESPSLEVMKLLEEWGAHVSFNDPFVEQIRWKGGIVHSEKITAERLAKANLVVLTTAHSTYDYDFVATNAQLIYDTRNGFRNVKHNRHKIAVLGNMKAR